MNETIRTYVEFSDELFDLIIELHAGGMSIPKICERPGMPDRTTFGRWCADDAALSRRRARARLDYADALFDEATDIANDKSGDIVWLEDKGGNTVPVVQHTVIQRAKLQVDTRLKIVAKINPAKYGERLELVGDQAEARGMTDEKLTATIVGLLAKLGIEPEALDALTNLVPMDHGSDPTLH